MYSDRNKLLVFNVFLFHVSNDEQIACLQFDKCFKSWYKGSLQIF